jgi:diphthamide biosynthesis enzyme Dph1/Dph2-like protein
MRHANVYSMQVLYVFVEIQFDTKHLVTVLTKNFPAESRIALMGTIQFTNALHRAHQELTAFFPHMRIPQGKPLSPGRYHHAFLSSTAAPVPCYYDIAINVPCDDPLHIP